MLGLAGERVDGGLLVASGQLEGIGGVGGALGGECFEGGGSGVLEVEGIDSALFDAYHVLAAVVLM